MYVPPDRIYCIYMYMYVQTNIYSYSYAFVCTAVRARIGTTESTEHNTEKTLVKGKRPLCLPFQSNRTPLSPLSFSLCPRFGLAVLSKSSLPFFLSFSFRLSFPLVPLLYSFSVSLSPTIPAYSQIHAKQPTTWPFFPFDGYFCFPFCFSFSSSSCFSFSSSFFSFFFSFLVFVFLLRFAFLLFLIRGKHLCRIEKETSARRWSRNERR